MKEFKEYLIVKTIKYKRESKLYKKKYEENTLNERQYIDKINLMQDDIRQLLLKLSKEERELWLKKKGKDYEGHTPKKKRVKRKINKIKNN